MKMDLLERVARDTRFIFSVPGGIAEDVTLAPADQPCGGVVLRGFFELPSADVRPGSARIATIMRGPRISLCDGDVFDLLGRPLKRGDLITVRGVTYRVENPRPDGIGCTVCDLKEKAEK